MFALLSMDKLHLIACLIILLTQCRGSLQLQDDEIVNSPGKLSDLPLIAENKLETPKPLNILDRVGVLSGALTENMKVLYLQQKKYDDDHILNDEKVTAAPEDTQHSLQKKQSELPSIPLNHVNGMYIRESSSPDANLHHLSRVPRQAPSGPAVAGPQERLQRQLRDNPEQAQKLRELQADANARYQQQVAQNQERAEAWKDPAREQKFQGQMTAMNDRVQDPERAKQFQDQMSLRNQGVGDPEQAQKMKENFMKLKEGGGKKLKERKKGSGKRRGKGERKRKMKKGGLKDKMKGGSKKRKEGGHKGRRKGKKGHAPAVTM